MCTDMWLGWAMLRIMQPFAYLTQPEVDLLEIIIMPLYLTGIFHGLTGETSAATVKDFTWT